MAFGDSNISGRRGRRPSWIVIQMTGSSDRNRSLAHIIGGTGKLACSEFKILRDFVIYRYVPIVVIGSVVIQSS
jgi:hypothetical protein